MRHCMVTELSHLLISVHAERLGVSLGQDFEEILNIVQLRCSQVLSMYRE